MLSTMLIKGLTTFLTKLVVGVASEKMVAHTFFTLAEAVARSTATKHDDEWVEKLKASYNEVK